MRFYLSSVTVLCLLFSNANLAQAESMSETIAFPVSEYCFPQTSVISKSDESSGFDKVSFSHNLIVKAEDYSKEGDVYVGFIDKRQSETIWLTANGKDWGVSANPSSADAFRIPASAYDGGTSRPLLLAGSESSGDILQPIIPITFKESIDVSTYLGYGEIWIGYGLRVDSKNSFEEMMQNQRFEKVWDISGNMPISGIPSSIVAICLHTNEMKKITVTPVDPTALNTQ